MIKYLLLLLAGLAIGYWYGWTDHDTYSEPLHVRVVHSIGGANRGKVKTDADGLADSIEKH
jgi:hypothetical protein